MAQHTLGPWEVQSGEDACFHQGNRFAITKSGTDGREPWQVTIAEIWPATAGADEADARLIASAPELLEALHELEALFDYQGDARPYTWQERLPMLERARAAIAKAEGRA